MRQKIIITMTKNKVLQIGKKEVNKRTVIEEIFLI